MSDVVPHIPEGEPVATGKTDDGSGEWAVYADKTRVLAQGGDTYYDYLGELPSDIKEFCELPSISPTDPCPLTVVLAALHANGMRTTKYRQAQRVRRRGQC